MRRLVPGVLAIALLAMPAAADAVPKKRPWATINVCDTDRVRNLVGVRAGMPGNGTRQRMRMRFELQWLAPPAEEGERRRWERVGRPSKWVSAGSARFRQAQRGWTFPIADPPEGERYRLRGVVRFQWRARRPVRPGSKRRRVVVVRKAARRTRGGLRGVAGGRPPRSSHAFCVVDGPERPPAAEAPGGRRG